MEIVQLHAEPTNAQIEQAIMGLPAEALRLLVGMLFCAAHTVEEGASRPVSCQDVMDRFGCVFVRRDMDALHHAGVLDPVTMCPHPRLLDFLPSPPARRGSGIVLGGGAAFPSARNACPRDTGGRT